MISPWAITGPQFGRLLRQTQVGSRLVIIHKVLLQQLAKMALIQNHDMIQTITPDRTHQTLGEGILPRTAGGQ